MRLNDFLPRTDDGLRSYSANFAEQLAVHYAAVSVTQAMSTTYADLQETYAKDLAASQAQETKGPQATLVKNQSRDLLVAETRRIARQIQGYSGTTETLRGLFQLPIRKTTHTNINPPAFAPKVSVLGVMGRTFYFGLENAESPSKARPKGVANASIFYCVGATASGDATAYTYAGTTTRGKIEVTLPESIPAGTTVWFVASFANAKAQTGPASQPIPVTVQYGTSMKFGSDAMKIAA